MEFDVKLYLRLVVKWWWLLVIGTVIPVVVSYYFLSHQAPLYQTRVVLMVGTTMQSANPDIGKMSIAEQLARGYAKIVGYRPVTSAVIEKLGLNRKPEVLAGQITAFVQPDANLLEIRVVDSNPQLAALIANALAEELIRQSPGSQTQSEQQLFVEQQLVKLKAKIEQVEKEIEDQKAALTNLTSAAEIKTAEENLAGLETVLSRYRSEHTSYLQSYAGASVNQLTIVEPAVEPVQPVAGKKALTLGIAALAGMGLAVAGVFLIEFMDDTLQWSGTQEETLFGLPVLGALGRMPNSPGAIIGRTRERSPEAEAVRTLRTNILLRWLNREYNTLLLSSPGSGEGKSFTAANLGVSMAAEGLRVVLVDADMRKPVLHELFDRPNTFGLADLLMHDTPMADVESVKGLQATGLPGLLLLSAGQIPLDPAVLLMSPHFPRLVESLRKHADVVIFDSPPVLAMADVKILVSRVESMAVVVANGVTTRSQLKEASRRLEELGPANILGMIFNGVKLRDHTHAYYYYYHSGSGRFAWLLKAWHRLAHQGGRTEMTPEDPDWLFTVPEAADRLGVSRAVAWRWGKRGRLPLVRQGLRWLVRQEDLDAFIDLESPGQGESGAGIRGNGHGLHADEPVAVVDVQGRVNVEGP